MASDHNGEGNVNTSNGHESDAGDNQASVAEIFRALDSNADDENNKWSRETNTHSISLLSQEAHRAEIPPQYGVCYFFTLSTELRLKIYEYALLVSDKESNAKEDGCVCMFFRGDSQYIQTWLGQRLDVYLLGVCQVIRNEAYPIWLTVNVFELNLASEFVPSLLDFELSCEKWGVKDKMRVLMSLLSDPSPQQFYSWCKYVHASSTPWLYGKLHHPADDPLDRGERDVALALEAANALSDQPWSFCEKVVGKMMQQWELGR